MSGSRGNRAGRQPGSERRRHRHRREAEEAACRRHHDRVACHAFTETRPHPLALHIEPAPAPPAAGLRTGTTRSATRPDRRPPPGRWPAGVSVGWMRNSATAASGLASQNTVPISVIPNSVASDVMAAVDRNDLQAHRSRRPDTSKRASPSVTQSGMRSTRALLPGRTRRSFFNAGDHFLDGRCHSGETMNKRSLLGAVAVGRHRVRMRRQHQPAWWRLRRQRGGWWPHTSRQDDDESERGPVRGRFDLLPQHGGRDAVETHGAPDAHAARPDDEDAAARARRDGGDGRAAARSRCRRTTSTPQPRLHARELHALHEVGRRDHRQRSRQPGQRDRLRGQRQLDRVPPDRGEEVRRRAPSAGRCPTRSWRATPTCSPPASARWACPTPSPTWSTSPSTRRTTSIATRC